MWLEKYTKNANFIMRSLYSMIIMFNIYFMQTLYVKKSFFSSIGLAQPERYYRIARANFNRKFPDFALDEAITFVNSFRGFNFITKPLWRWILKVRV